LGAVAPDTSAVIRDDKALGAHLAEYALHEAYRQAIAG
jgi:hypothetical protein